ncbi:MAG TPA: SEC-C metal-binding domain-containing protein, partial [Propionicimonas sp.]
DLTVEQLVEDFQADAQKAYDARTELLGAETMREFERQVLLTVLDRKWREHLYEMDYLREGIGLRAMAQRDPLVEYQREGGDMFNAMMEAFMEEVVGYLFNLEVRVEPAAPVGLVAGPNGKAVTADDLVAAGALASAEPARSTMAPEPGLTKRPQLQAKGLEKKAPRPMAYSAPTETGEAARTGTSKNDDPYAGVGRNAPCPCGSGKKFKQCHGRVA